MRSAVESMHGQVQNRDLMPLRPVPERDIREEPQAEAAAAAK